MQMKKAKFMVESCGTVGNAYRLKLPRTGKEVRMTFNDWLNFFNKTFGKTEDFALYHFFTGIDGYLMLYQGIGGIIETSKPHALHIYADNIEQAWMLRLLEKYRPQYGEKAIAPIEKEPAHIYSLDGHSDSFDYEDSDPVSSDSGTDSVTTGYR